MNYFCLNVEYDPESETVSIANMSDFESETKVYDEIRTAGDVGRATKDYVMGVEQDA